MGSCNQCGKCCEAIVLNIPMSTILRIAKSKENKFSDPSYKFCSIHWHEISQTEAFMINPYLKDQERCKKINNAYFYTCDKFGKESRLCMCHDTRPPVCKGYPWYSKDVHPEDPLYSASCGFKTDGILVKK